MLVAGHVLSFINIWTRDYSTFSKEHETFMICFTDNGGNGGAMTGIIITFHLVLHRPAKIV